MSEPKVEGFYAPRYEELSIKYSHRNDEKIAIINNFPGIFAEMNEEELRKMGNSLFNAADKLVKQ